MTDDDSEATDTDTPCDVCGEIWERLRKVSDAACFHDLREAVDDVVATLEDAGWGGVR